MRLFLLASLTLALLTGCGSGSSPATVADELPVFPLSGDRLTWQPRTIAYQLSGELRIDGGDPIPLSGSASHRQGLPATVGSALCANLEMLETIDGSAPALRHSYTTREEESNVALQRGRRLTDGSLLNWHTPLASSPLRFIAGESWTLPAPTLGYAQTIGAARPRLEMEEFSWSVDRVGVIDVPAGRFECFVVYATERLLDLDTGVVEVCSTLSYIRPEMGLIQKEVRLTRTVDGVRHEYRVLHEATDIR